MKRIIALVSIALLAFGAAACTREKPPVTEPTVVGTPSVFSQPALPGGTSTLVILYSATPTVPATFTRVLENPTPLATLSLGTSTAPTLVATASSGGATTYTVQWGDWINKIATKFGVTIQALVNANPGLDPNHITPGQVLNIPATGGSSATPAGITPPTSGLPNTYTVQRGDWFYAIARKFGVTVAALQSANPNVDPTAIYPGQVLNIPGGGGSGTEPTPATRTGQTYTVQVGDTLYSIAVRFNKTVYELQIANQLPNAGAIYVGQTLVIP